MPFRFEGLEVWRQALDYVDLIYDIAAQLPESEEDNLRPQITRAATLIATGIVEASTGQTSFEQARILGFAARSLLETVACQHIISKRKLLSDLTPLRQAYVQSQAIFGKLQEMRKALGPIPAPGPGNGQNWIREDGMVYDSPDGQDTPDNPMTWWEDER